MKTARDDRTAETRNAIMAAAERLFAEHGLSVVSNRQIAEAAGQRNNAVVGYHFGSKTDLVRAIMTRRGEQTDRIRAEHVAALGDSDDLRDWVGALVRPATEHLASLGTPSWNARLTVQVMTDPTMRVLVSEEACTRPHLRQILDGLGRCLADVPAAVRTERGAMARNLITSMCAERERALAENTGLLHHSWAHTADALTDAIVGLLTAPVTRRRA
ncbi:TetR/AcrR family transcriptional regulator [Streptomyces iconiensis]|uniref:Helix-turn-helix domain-containing protein n=1 Tax=Streptomyces iconiensis TaxID=1384038 RepID=A0ABT6ZZI8_9ACTN|nr:TetR/AcrR family transcriptional regulator [Streptomyces iconiensis]MDJ1134493.1 helix-turn-helix domain-containing protein [Streptomyces iconiensis]